MIDKPLPSFPVTPKNMQLPHRFRPAGRGLCMMSDGEKSIGILFGFGANWDGRHQACGTRRSRRA